MVVPKTIRTRNSFGLISYIVDDPPHTTNLVHQRNLLIDGKNLAKDYHGKFNSLLTESQFYASRIASHKRDKATQAYHLIFSFSDQEFPLTDDPKILHKQAVQARNIVKSFLSDQLEPNSQYLLAVQRDGEGKKLHVHVALNTILTNGRTLNTNDLSILQKHVRVKTPEGNKIKTKPGLFANLQNYMAKNFKNLTGRDYTPVHMRALDGVGKQNQLNVQRGDMHYVKERGARSWREDLKSQIKDVIKQARNLDDFKAKMESVYGVRVADRESKITKLDDGTKVTRPAFTYQIMATHKDGTQYVKHAVRDFRITSKYTVRGLGEFSRPYSIENEIDKRLGIDPNKGLSEEEKAKRDFIEQYTQRRKTEVNQVERNSHLKKTLEEQTAKAQKTHKQMLDAKKKLDQRTPPDTRTWAEKDQDYRNASLNEKRGIAEKHHMSVFEYWDYLDNKAETEQTKPSQTKSVQAYPELEPAPKPTAVQNLAKAKSVTESKSGEKADDLKQSLDTNAQRMQEQQQARATAKPADNKNYKKNKKKQTKPVQAKSAKQLKKEQNARLDAELHNKIQNLDEPWKDNEDQDENGFDDFADF